MIKWIQTLKRQINKFFINTKLVYKADKLVFWLVFGIIINGILLRALTLEKTFDLAPFFADIFVTVFLTSFYFFMNPKVKKIYLIFNMLISLTVCISNVVYYSFYNSFISITFISFVLTNLNTGESNINVALDLLRIKYILFFWLPVFLFFLNNYYKTNKIPKFLKFLAKKEKKNDDEEIKPLSRKKVIRTVYIWVAISGILLLFCLKPVDYTRFSKQWNREILVQKFGVYLYQINDIVTSIQPKMASLFGSDKAYKEVTDFYDSRSNTYKNNKYTDIFKGKNVIAIHAESIQYHAMTQKFNGKEVTPNLNKLANEGISFTKFYSQASFGTSSDTEFTLATSLLPVNTGTVFINYFDKEYPSAYKLLQEQGYYIFSMHGNTGDFWNRNIMHKTLGYNDFFEKSSYVIDEKFGLGLSDRSFMLQSVDKISKIAEEHEKFYGTLITLSNHTPFTDLNYYGEFDVSMSVNNVTYPYMEGTKLGNYFKSARYADEQIGLLIDELDKRGLLDNTIIIIYGDHDAKISRKDWERLLNYDYENNDIIDKDDPNYIDIDYYWYELNRNVPFIIWSKDKNFQKNYSTTVNTVAGMYDVMPTLGNMMGFRNEYALGSDIFSVKDNLVAFANGNFITNYVYYRDSKSEYKLLKDKPLDENYITKNKELTDEFIKISNNIIIHNYFGSEIFNNREEIKK